MKTHRKIRQSLFCFVLFWGASHGVMCASSETGNEQPSTETRTQLESSISESPSDTQQETSTKDAGFESPSRERDTTAPPGTEKSEPTSPAPDSITTDSSTPEPGPSEKNREPDVSPGAPYTCPTIRTSKVPTKLGLDPFYKKYLSAGGIPIVGSAKVPDTAFAQAYYVIANMLRNKPCIRKAIVQSGIRIGIIAESEVTTDMPEYSDFYKVWPNIDWNKRGRGFGATLVRPLTTGAVENLLQKRSDRWFGENILLHEFAHSFFEFGILSLENGPQHRATLKKLYNGAIQAGLWDKTYAKTNENEYWAETVQSFFNNNLSADPPNGVHNNINTREKLKKYDPKMAAFLTQFFDPAPWSAYCTFSSNGRAWKDPTPSDPNAATCKFHRMFLNDLGCANVTQIKSLGNSQKQSVTFVNRTFQNTYNVEWIDFQGQRKLYRTLPPRRQVTLSTFQGHSWVMTNRNKQCVSVHTTTHPNNIVVVGR